MLRIRGMRRAIVVLAVLASTAALAQEKPDLVVRLSSDGVILPALPVAVEVLYFNFSRASFAATGTVITLTSTEPFVDLPANCTASGNQAVCYAGTVTTEPRTFTVSVRAPDARRETFRVTAEISSPDGDGVPSNNVFTSTLLTENVYFVTTAADSGPGSLREVINTTNPLCTEEPCTIGFRIPNATAPWVTIATATPLPPITATDLLIDGGTQALFFGDTNPDGPEVELTGAANGEGDGLVYRGCGFFRLRNLAVNGFPGSGVLLTGFPACRSTARAEVSKSYIGTDPTGMRAVRNQRGVSVDGVPFAAITGNVISGNLRSGVYAQQGQVRVQNNRIGLTRERTPLGNGASGVYIGPLAHGSDVSANFIGFNAHWGIAIGAGATLVSAAGNSLQGHFGLGIDWGHDMNPLNGPFPAPEITSARVENGRTIIEGTNPPLGISTSEVHLYVSDAPHWTGYGEGQEPLGPALVRTTTFSLTVDRDLRGKWITATFTHRTPAGFARPPRAQDINGFFTSTTSELSRAVEVR
jgi:hypothetical protein